MMFFEVVGRNEAGQPDQHVARAQLTAGEHGATFDDTDQRAGNVERVGCVDTGHLRGFAAEQRTAGCLARLRHSGDDACGSRA